ncbi:MAG TPA: FtsX-like permease family protein [Terriglobales bacterium]|jgi:putative ABC transport system permease protein|nr:FtsX-like permease family protein [Terriglobales bacterium]
MTLARFVRKNAFRNKRRSILTILSVGFSLLLLTFMITIWRSFYIDQGSVQSAQRLMVRHKVSLVFSLPAFYREKIRAIPGVQHVVNMQWFGGQYKDDRSQNYFAQFGVDPNEFFQVYTDMKIPQDQIEAWQKDRAGAVVDAGLANKFGWKVGDRLNIKGLIFPLNLELTIRGIFTAPSPTQSIYFNKIYLDEGYTAVKGSDGVFAVLVDSPEAVSRVATTIDEQFRNSPKPTKSESEHAFQLGFIAMLGNVKAFILSICLAVVFAILLVSATTMAMSVRERTREVAVLKTLGFEKKTILSLFVGEAVALSLAGGILGTGVAFVLVALAASQGGFLTGMKVTPATIVVAMVVAALVGFLSAFIPSYRASQINIVDGLRHIG